MAKFRKIHTSFWSDPFVGELTPEQKYFYLYLLTNEYTKQCGIYELSVRLMCFDTGYNSETVNRLLLFFEEKKKIALSRDTNEIAVINWLRYNDSTSPKVKQCIKMELKTVKNTVLIQYLYSIDTHTQEEKEKEKEEEEESGDNVSLIFEAFKKVAPAFPDEILIQEANKFILKYPECNIKKSGALVNAWAARIEIPVKKQSSTIVKKMVI